MHLIIPFPQFLQPEIIPGLPFRWYGMMYLVAFAITYVLTLYQVKQRRLEVSTETVTDFFFWGIVGLLIGARLFSALIFDETGYYWRNPLRIFWPFDESRRFVGIQGMNYYGGLLGAVVGFMIYGRRKGLDVVDFGDMMTAAIPLGYTFGRVGNFINGELFGRVTTAPWGVIFPHAQEFPAGESWVQETARAAGLSVPADPSVLVNLPRHPTQLYEALFEGVIAWLVIWFFLRNRRPFRGFIIGIYVLSYGAFRFVIDYFRMPLGSDYLLRFASDPSIPPYRLLTPWNFIASQAWSLLMVVAGIVILIVFKRLSLQAAEPTADAGETESRGGSRRKLRKRINRIS